METDAHLEVSDQPRPLGTDTNVTVQPPATTYTNNSIYFHQPDLTIAHVRLPCVQQQQQPSAALLDCKRDFTGNEMKSDTPL